MSGSKKASAASPSRSIGHSAIDFVLHKRLQRCWEEDINWNKIPTKIKKGLEEIGLCYSIPPVAALAGLILIVSFSMLHSVVKVEDSELMEPVIVWISICMPPGSTKSPLCNYLRELIKKAKSKAVQDVSKLWMLGDQSFEKLGELMSDNQWKILGLYDELPAFLSQINVCRGRTLAESQQVSTFLALYGGCQWIRRTVSGDANFNMDYTGLSIGGFTQVNVARGFIESTANVEKGLIQRFHWLIPKPYPKKFKDLKKIDTSFSDSVVNLMVAQWKPDTSVTQWILPKQCKLYQEKFDDVFEQLTKLSYTDDLLAGMLSKSRGQILRIAAVLHVIFHVDTPHNIPLNIADSAITVAIEFVELCIQHVMYITGRGKVQAEVDSIHQELQAKLSQEESSNHYQAMQSAELSLTLPGKVLNMSVLISQKKFRNTGNKKGGLDGWKLLDADGLGVLSEQKAGRGTDKLYEFIKKEVTEEDGEDIAQRLLKYGVTLEQYEAAYELADVTMESYRETVATKRKSGTSNTPAAKRALSDE